VTIAFSSVTDNVGFRELEPAWRALGVRSRSNQIFQDFDWCWRSWECVAAPLDRRLRILVGRVDGRVVLIWPCMIAGPYLRLLSCELFQFSDVLVEAGPDSGAWLRAALRALRGLGGQALLLKELRADSVLSDHLRRYPARGLKRTSQRVRLLHLDRYASWDAYLGRLPRQLRADQRRQWRRIEASAPGIRFELVNDRMAQRNTIRWIFDRKVAWLKERNASAEFLDSREYRRFCESVCDDLHARGITFVGRLVAGTAIIAAVIGFFREEYFTFFMFAYDPAWHRYSPGRLVMERCIRHCFDQGVTTFDFMLGDEDYKEKWSDEDHVVEDYAIPSTLLGHAVLHWHANRWDRVTCMRWWRVVSRCFPGVVRRRIGERFTSQAEILGEMRPV
jgi:CelD/BcsL family acetyltransferase involved in cellulose biosynthesis